MEGGRVPSGPWVRHRVHNLKHTCGRRLHAAGVPLETRKVCLGHRDDDITTHYAAAEIGELIAAFEKLCERREGIVVRPRLRVVRGTDSAPENGKVTQNSYTPRRKRTRIGAPDA
jgi:hypothetical protein